MRQIDHDGGVSFKVSQQRLIQLREVRRFSATHCRPKKATLVRTHAFRVRVHLAANVAARSARNPRESDILMGGRHITMARNHHLTNRVRHECCFAAERQTKSEGKNIRMGTRLSLSLHTAQRTVQAW